MSVAFEQLLAPGYLDGIEARSLPELRAMRSECQEVETGLSMLRRIVQGHLDIAGVELERRAGGAASGDRADLLARLPELLADRTTGSGPGRLTSLMAPESVDPTLEAELAALLGGGASDPSGLEREALQSLVDGLAAFEGRVSGHRRAMFDRLDALQEEIARRYRSGDASVDALLT